MKNINESEGGMGDHNHEDVDMGGVGDHLSIDTQWATEASFALFAILAKQAELAERVASSFALQRQALLRDHADDPLVLAGVWRLEESERRAQEVAASLKNGAGRGKKRVPGLRDYCPDPRVVAFAKHTAGLGDAVFFFLGLLPQWVGDFATVSKLWAYCGLHVRDGAAPRKGQLKGGGTPGDWSPYLKAIAIKRLAEPCMKVRTSPYRAVYDTRRAHTAVTHPDWTDGHSHNDAQRVTAKAILRDLWRVSRGHEPLFGGDQHESDTHVGSEPTKQRPSHEAGGGDHWKVADTQHRREAPARNEQENTA